MRTDETSEAFRLLPDSFVEAYARLCDLALPGIRGRPVEIDRAKAPGHRSRLTSNGRDLVMSAGAAKQSGIVSVGDPIGSQSAFSFKATVDRKLRKLAREMNQWSRDVGKQQSRRCSGRCKKWCDATYNFCPWCGAATENV